MKNSSFQTRTTRQTQIVHLLMFLLFYLACIPSNLFGADVSLTWNKNTEPDLAGYRIYQRLPPSTAYGSPIFSGLPSNPNAPQKTITALLPDTTYGFISTAFDTSGNESPPSNESIITTPRNGGNPTNQAPTTSAGPNQTITLPDSATLNGTVSDDGLPTPPGAVTTTWTKVSGPTTVAFGDPSAVDTTASFSGSGVYVLRLTANDGALSRSDDLTITVNPAGGSNGDVTISNLQPSAYTVMPSSPGLQVGNRLYIDRSYTFTSLPASVQGAAYIQTANHDKYGKTDPFISITVDQPVTIYVAHDGRIALPVWLTNMGFVDTGQNIETTDTSRDLFVQTFPAGAIRLGGNEFGGSMYSVIVQTTEGGNPTNQAPTTSAGPNQTITLPDSATLNGNVSDDGLPTSPGAVTTTWTKVSGPTTVAFGDPSAVDTTASFSGSGVYVLRLTANDGALSRSDDLTITVNPAGGSGGDVTISNLQPSAYTVMPSSPGLQVGNRLYIDRSYTFTSLPTSIQGAAYIQTANNDKYGKTDPFISMTVDQPVTIYVAHDGRIALPVWLTNMGFVDTGQNIETTDTSRDLFVQTFPAGAIRLGGNEHGGSMYSVIVQATGEGN